MTATKLTLRLDADVISQGKAYAKRKGTSLSKLFEEYLREQVMTDYEPVIVVEVSPEVMAHTASYRHEVQQKTDAELSEEYMEYLYNKGN